MYVTNIAHLSLIIIINGKTLSYSNGGIDSLNHYKPDETVKEYKINNINIRTY